MSDRRLNEQALRLRPDPLITPTRTPVLMSDSKGLTLKEQVGINPVLNIELLWKKGATAEDRLGYLQENLSQNLIHLNQITLFVWIGTFNLTTKSDGFIKLASTIYSNSAFELINILKQIYHFVHTFGPSVKLVFCTSHYTLYIITTNFTTIQTLINFQIKILLYISRLTLSMITLMTQIDYCKCIGHVFLKTC